MLKDLNSDQKLQLAYIGNLIKGVAHNINTPLSTIFGRTEMAKIRLEKILKDSPCEELQKCLKDIYLVIDNSRKLHSIIDHITQKTIKSLVSDTCHINIGTVLKDDLELLNSDMFFKHKVEKIINIHDDIPKITGKHLDFSISFLEILENSKESMINSKIKKLEISTSFNSSSIEVIFKDTGCGIKHEDLSRIYNCLKDPSEIKERETGLMRVGRLMKPYSAKFFVDSTQYGTIFKISIPL